MRYFDFPFKAMFGLSLFNCLFVLQFPYFCKSTYVISTLASNLITSCLLGSFLQITNLSLSIVQFPGFSISIFPI